MLLDFLFFLSGCIDMHLLVGTMMKRNQLCLTDAPRTPKPPSCVRCFDVGDYTTARTNGKLRNGVWAGVVCGQQ